MIINCTVARDWLKDSNNFVISCFFESTRTISWRILVLCSVRVVLLRTKKPNIYYFTMWKILMLFVNIKFPTVYTIHYFAVNVTTNKYFGIASFGQTMRFTAENHPIKLSYFIEPYKSKSEVSSGLAPPANFQIYCGLISITFHYLCSRLWKGRATRNLFVSQS